MAKNKIVLPIRSIRGKLILLGVVAVAATAILGMMGLYSADSTSRNNALLSAINEVKLLDNENQTLNVEFLYQLENAYNEQMRTNAEQMEQTLALAVKKGGKTYRSDLSALQAEVQKTKENLQKLQELMGSRGFKESDGEYANFVSGDEALFQSFQQMESEDGAWVDAPWKTFTIADLPTEEVDGVTYAKLSHTVEIPMKSKRDILALRLGQGGVRYQGQVYVTKVSFDGQDMDFSKLKDEDLASSWGGCFENMGMQDFDGKKAIHYTGAYHASNEDEWTEVVMQIPISEYDVQNHHSVSYDIYLEVLPEMPVQLNSTTCYTGKFDFASTLSKVNEIFSSYSKSIAEGTEASEAAEEIASNLVLLTDNVSAYSMNKELNAKLTDLLKKKEDAFTAAKEEDQEIVQIKKENNECNAQILSSIQSLQTSIKNHTDATHHTTLIVVIVVFLISVLNVSVLTLFVTKSIGKSIHQFSGTLQLLSQGDMTAKAQVDRGDEFDEFGLALNQMTEKIASILLAVRKIASDVNQSGNNLEGVAKGTDENSSVIGASIRDIVMGANDQAKDVEDSTLQMSKLGELMDTIVENAVELDDASDHMQAASTDVQQILQKLSESNHNMTTGIGQIADLIRETNESVEQISDAANLISSIAEETNLLSLNASIEAARAGEVGKGFAVVALEIQQLADQTNKSADSISTVIKNLTEGFRHTVDTMAEVQHATDEQNENFAETMRKFAIVNEGISASRSGTMAIRESIQACDDIRNRINELLLNLSALSEEYAAATTQTGDSMESLNDAIHELLTASEQLSHISGELEENMTYFQL